MLNEAVKINPDTKTVTVKDLRTGGTYEETYDNLILSMGAEPIRPNIEGADGSNVFTLRNIPDIYAVGDAVEVEDFLTKKPTFIPLAGPANKQGKIAADNIAGYLCSMKKLINYQVRVTKKSGDSGIDGTGKLRINGIFSFNVAFQCKRYILTLKKHIIQLFMNIICTKI